MPANTWPASTFPGREHMTRLLLGRRGAGIDDSRPASLARRQLDAELK